MSIIRNLRTISAAAAAALATGVMLLAGQAPTAHAAPAPVGTLWDPSCPYNLKTSAYAEPCTVRLQNLLNAKEHAGLTVDGNFGTNTKNAVVRWQQAHGLTADGIAGPATKNSLGEKKPGGWSAVGGSISRTEVQKRGANWIWATVPYSMTAYYPDAYGKSYRTDCSGFVSESWHLPSSLNTNTLRSVSTRLSAASQLKMGDVLIRQAGWGGHKYGHTVMFVKFANAQKSSMVIYQESAYGGINRTNLRTVTVHEYIGGGYVPYRYNKITG